jgi:hypothetical protein
MVLRQATLGILASLQQTATSRQACSSFPAIVDAANGNAGKGGNLSINAPNGNIIVTTPNEGIVTRSEAGSNFGNSSNAGAVSP